MDIQFKYSAIKIDRFATFDAPETAASEAVTFSGEVQTGNNYDARTIMITVLSNLKMGDQLVAIIKVSSYFEIGAASWDALKEDSVVIIPKEFLYHIGGLAVSTTCGIFFDKTEGTDLSRYILPIIYMEDVIRSDMKIPVPEQPSTAITASK